MPRPLLGFSSSSRKISIKNIHTGYGVNNLIYFENGQYIDSSLAELNKIFCDHRTGEISNIHPKLYDLLFLGLKKINSQKTFHLVSGYRSPHSNEHLRAISNGVAKNSLHLQGMAADIFIEGIPISALKKVFTSLKSGGVGHYNHFLHVDIGRIRTW